MFHLQISPALCTTSKATIVPENTPTNKKTPAICRICDEKVGIEKWYLSFASLTLDRSTKKIQKMQNEYLKHCLNGHWILFG